VLEADGFALADDVRVVTERYMRVRYGGGAIETQERAQMREAISRVRRAPKLEVADKKAQV
ncbi:MAG: hypothetical protein RL701_4048, partial [Pseudomonadota bacterium]